MGSVRLTVSAAVSISASARSDLHACLTQDSADRLDPELAALNDAVAVDIDVLDDHRDRHLAGSWVSSRDGYLILRSSSASLVASSVVVPGRTPPSISA